MAARTISWLKGAAKEFAGFPVEAQLDVLAALRVAALGETADSAKPFKGVGSGVFEIAQKHRGDAFRVIYAVQIDAAVGWSTPFRRNRKAGSKPRRSTWSGLKSG